MRVMVTVAFRAESGNTAIYCRKIERIFKRIMEELKPEAAYFFPERGARAGLFVLDMKDSSQLADTAERFFLGLNARIEMVPLMSAEDLQEGLLRLRCGLERDKFF
jgi:hypothetical protein